jgi:cytoplasmic tRNA 2-thiolation protein 2
MTVQKFRGVLDPTLKSAGGPPRGHLKATGNLLMGFSGGLGSTVLLDLVKRCYFTPPDPSILKGGKRHPWKSGNVWAKVIVCYVDCSQAYEGVSYFHKLNKFILIRLV